MPARFRAIVVMEGVDTGDRRHINVGALTTRALPLTLMGMTRNPDGGWGHDAAEVVGGIETLTRTDFSAEIDEKTGQTWADVAGGPVFAWVGEGEFSDRPQGVDVENLVRAKHLRGVSVDLAAVTSELEVIEEDEDGWPIDWLERLTEGEIGAATVCNIPAFRGCTIEIIDDAAEDGDATDPSAEDVEAIAASTTPWLPAFRILNDGPGCEPCVRGEDDQALVAAGGPMHPPAAWFTDPGLDGPTALTITDDGRVFGHLALWGSCHTGFSGQCVTPPRSQTGYANFRVGAVRTAEGDDVAIGHITMGTGHADLKLGMAAAMAHYDDTGSVAADIAAGDDDHGIWVAGALRPDLTDGDLRALRAAPLSGDWRRQGVGLELIAALAVNVPGFLVPRVAAVAASGVPQSLVAAGALATRKATEGGVTTELKDLLAELRLERQHRSALARLRRGRTGGGRG